MKIYTGVLALLVGLSSVPQTYAWELGMASGFYQHEKNKSDGKDAGGKTTISLGARIGDVIEGPYHWFAEPIITMRSYDAPEGGKAASDSTSIALRGGARMYFPEFSDSWTPFLSAQAAIANQKDADGTMETETSGLLYGASAGFRINFHKRLFFDIECSLFENALFATVKKEPIDSSSGTKKSETTTTELLVDSRGSVSSTKFGIGMKF